MRLAVCKVARADVFLLQKAVNVNIDKVHYLKNNDSIVKTKPENDLYKLMMQRVRWAAKTASYKSNYAKFLAVVVLLMNSSLVCGLWFMVCGFYGLWFMVYGLWFVVCGFMICSTCDAEAWRPQVALCVTCDV